MRVVIVVLLVCLSPTGLIHAQDAQPPELGATGEVAPDTPQPEAQPHEREYVEEARLLYLAGERAFADGRFEGALQSFRRAFELTGDAALLYNIGVTADRLRRDEEALSAFEQYLEQTPDAEEARVIRGRIRILREQIAERRLRDSQPAPTPVQTTPAPVPVEPPERDDGGFFSQWWVWTIAGVLVAGGVAATLFLTATEDDPSPGTEGVVLRALELP